MSLLQRVSPVVFDCLQPIISCPREILHCTPTACGMIDTKSHTALERWAYFESFSSCGRHHSVMSGIHNVLLISIGSEWQSLRFGYIYPLFFGALGGEFKCRLAGVDMRGAWWLLLGDVSATFVGIKYSSSSQDKSYGSKDNWRDAEAVVEGMKLLLCTFLWFINRHTLLFGTIFILRRLQKGLLVLGSIGCLFLRINRNSPVLLPKQLQLAERIENLCWNQHHKCHWSHHSIIFAQLLSS